MKLRTIIQSLAVGCVVIALIGFGSDIQPPQVEASNRAAQDWCEAQNETCWETGENRVRECEYRNEGIGPDNAYTSCACQGTREYKRCMDLGGCSAKARAELLGLEHCFTPQ